MLRSLTSKQISFSFFQWDSVFVTAITIPLKESAIYNKLLQEILSLKENGNG